MKKAEQTQQINILALEELSRIELCAEQREKMKRELEDFAAFAEILSSPEYSKSEAAPLGARALEECNTREDVAVSSDEKCADGYICVPLTAEAEL